MFLPQKLIDVLERNAIELKESDDETGEQEYAADSDTQIAPLMKTKPVK